MSEVKESAPAISQPTPASPKKSAAECGCGSTVETPTTDTLPTASELSKAHEIKVFDTEGKEHTFQSVAQPEGVQKNLVIFIRHFFCGICQDYLKTISDSLPPSALPPGTTLTIIGQGDPQLIQNYQSLTACPYPIYTDPSRKLYAILSLQRNASAGAKKPSYLKQSWTSVFFGGITQGLKAGRLAVKSGEPFLNGGEFLFVKGSGAGDGEDGGGWTVEWTHRMKNTRDHTEIPEIANVLGAKVKGGEQSSNGTGQDINDTKP